MGVDLYRVTAGPDIWLYTSGEFDVQTATDLWVAHPIKRKDLSYDLKQNSITMTVPSELEPFGIYKIVTPLLPIHIEIYDYPSMGLKFRGDIKGIAYDANKDTATVTIGSTAFLDDTMIPNRTYGFACSFDLYGEGCWVNKAAHTVTVPNSEVNWIQPDLIQHSAFADPTFTNGYVELDTGEAQFITTADTNGYVRLLWAVATRDKATTVSIVKSCNKSTQACETIFNNLPNYGGFPYIPSKNPVTERV
jgi:hypothetical protein